MEASARSASPALGAADRRLAHGHELLVQAEQQLAAGTPEALPGLIQELVRALRPLAQHAEMAGLAEQARRQEIARMGQRVAAMQMAVARTQASLARERAVLMSGMSGSPADAAPVYSAAGAVPSTASNKPASAVA